MKGVSVLIMAGGRSERMKSPKPFLLIQGKSFIEKILNEYSRCGIKNIYVVLNHRFVKYLPQDMSGFKVIPNFHPEYGRLYSLQLGLKKLAASDFVFIHNVDNPFADQELIRKMWAVRSEGNYVVPICNGRGGHPILIPKRIVKNILSNKNYERTLRDVLRQYDRIEVVTESEKILTNINTWQEYEERVLNLIPEYSCD